MKDKYIKFFKREVIFLLILLVVVCFSFGVTYSNFIYNSESHRAVEMFTSSLKYEVSINGEVTNKASLLPGNNVLNVEIKSLNNIDSYFKIIYGSNNNVDVAFYNNNSNSIINSNGKVELKIIVYNKKDGVENISFKVLGGFTTNKLSDIKTPEYYSEVNKNLNIGQSFTFNDKKFRLLSISNEGISEFISECLSTVNVTGANGYNKYISSLNSVIGSVDGSIYYHPVTIEDINKYLTTQSVTYKDKVTIENAYYPVLWGYEKDSVINTEETNGIISKSEEFDITEIYNKSDSISILNSSIENVNYINPIYKELLTGSNYFIATRSTSVNDGKALFEVLSMNNGNLTKSLLYDSNNNSYESENNVRVILRMPNNYNILYEEI